MSKVLGLGLAGQERIGVKDAVDQPAEMAGGPARRAAGRRPDLADGDGDQLRVAEVVSWMCPDQSPRQDMSSGCGARG
jgi:hypothetical protein